MFPLDIKSRTPNQEHLWKAPMIRQPRIPLRSCRLVHMFGPTVLILIYMENGIFFGLDGDDNNQFLYIKVSPIWIITTFSVVDNMKEQFYAQQGKTSRKENAIIKELFENIERLRTKFDSIERPNLEMENPAQEEETSEAETSTKPAESQSHPEQKTAEKPETETHKSDHQVKSGAGKADQGQGLDPQEELAKLESEFGKS